MGSYVPVSVACYMWMVKERNKILVYDCEASLLGKAAAGSEPVRG